MADKLIQDLGAGAFALTDLLEHQPIAGPPSLKGDVNALVTLLNTVLAPAATAPAAGIGSPEGVVTRSPGAPYTDTATGDFYTKQTGTGNTGWLLQISA